MANDFIPRGSEPEAVATRAELLHRVFSIDVLECANCGGRLRIVAAIHPPEAIQRILDRLGIPSRAPPIIAASRDGADWKVF